MKRSLFCFLAFIFTVLASAQTKRYADAMDVFEKRYNAENYEAIFNDFSPEMKNALPLENTKLFFTNLRNMAGEIKEKTFARKEASSGELYKVNFESGELGVFLYLDNENKIAGLFVKPYEQQIGASHINNLQAYPEPIANAIFEKTAGLPNDTQFSIAVIRNGKTEYYGIKKHQDTIQAVENQRHVFEIGSITKVFTSAVLASLVTNKKIDLDASIHTLFPFAFKDDIRLHFRDLANHTSGLPRLPENLDLSNETNPYKKYGQHEIETYLKNTMKLESTPNTQYSYSNLGAGLLGYALGLHEKMSFQELLEKEIFEKYGMSNTLTSSKNIEEKLVKGLDHQGNAIPNWDFDALFGGGGMLSTTEDLAKFANAHFNTDNKALQLLSIPTFTINQNTKIGLGWHILTTKNNVLWHNGGTGGYSSSMAIDKEKEFAVIILSNVSPSHSQAKQIDGLCFSLLKLLNK